MSIKNMKIYMNLCLEGESSIPERKVMLENTKKQLLLKIEEINECLEYIDDKQEYYQDILDHKIEYSSYIYKK